MQALPRDVSASLVAPPRPAYGRPDWTQDGKDWPNRTYSRFVRGGKWRWHVQIMGQGPVLLLLHGTGAATHSWRDMLPILAKRFMVVAPDLPGHGFTEQPISEGMTLPGMARGISALLTQLDLHPVMVAGHSAGAAIALQMCLDGLIAPQAVVALNGALLPLTFHGAGRSLMAPLAKLMASNPLVPMMFAWQAVDGNVVARLLKGTGSVIDPAGVKFYARLARRSGHAGAALKMMANWELEIFSARLAKLTVPLMLVVGSNDRSIPPADATKIQRIIPRAQIVRMEGLGHLAHEERPAETCEIIEKFAVELGVLPP